MASKLSAREMAELAAYADGTLPAERRGSLEARIAESPELQELLDRQRGSLAATKMLADEPTPASLRTTVEERTRGGAARRPRRRLVPGLALGSAAIAATAIVLVLALAGGPSGPTVADAARLASQPPSGPAPARLDHSQTKLTAHVDGVVFPDLTHPWGWRQVGVRHEQLDGRTATVVYYEKGAQRVGYVITAGSALRSPTGAESVTKHGVRYQTLDVDGHPAVTWERLGHTCVLTGTSPAELLRIASWRGGGTLQY
jgi:anti-sigma factor RsiW